MIKQLLKHFDKQDLSVETRRCLRLRVSQQSDDSVPESCDICEKNCPQGAISIHPYPSINTQDCKQCGLCAKFCPSQAFHNPNEELSQLYAFSSLKTMSIACTIGSDETPESSLKHNAVCGLSIMYLLSVLLLSDKRSLILDLRSCHECSFHKDGNTILADCQTVQAIAKAFQIEAEISVITKQTDLLPLDKTQGDAHSSLSRRDFLSLCLGKTKQLSQEFISEYGLLILKKQTTREFLWDKLTHQLQSKHYDKELVSKPSISEHLAWAMFAIKPTCNACGHCVRICPWDAWTLTIDKGEQVLCFSPQLCHNCQECLKTCPQDSITIKPFSTLLDYKTPWNTLALAKKPLQSCLRCKKAMTPSADKYCPNCTKQKSLSF